MTLPMYLPRPPRHRQHGFSLVELMISTALGLVILGAVATLFVNNSRTRQEIERSSRQIENGRYAIQLLRDDLQLAGFLAEFNPTPLDTSTLTALPDPCAADLPSLRTALPLHIQGYDNSNSLSCLTDVKTGTDVLVVRRTSTCVAGATGCDPVASGEPYFQASLCAPSTGGTELSYSPTSNADYAAQFYALDTSAANLTRHKYNCTTLADLRRYRTHIYFIANNNIGTDGVPTLKRAELGAGTFSIVPLVEGIENLQFEYGIDTTASPGDGTPDVYTANPSGYNSCAGTACVTYWRNVMAVKVDLLARNTETTDGYTDTKTYTLGLTAAGAANTVGPFNDRYKRHAYSTAVRLANPAGRRE